MTICLHSSSFKSNCNLCSLSTAAWRDDCGASAAFKTVQIRLQQPKQGHPGAWIFHFSTKPRQPSWQSASIQVHSNQTAISAACQLIVLVHFWCHVGLVYFWCHIDLVYFWCHIGLVYFFCHNDLVYFWCCLFLVYSCCHIDLVYFWCHTGFVYFFRCIGLLYFCCHIGPFISV